MIIKVLAAALVLVAAGAERAQACGTCGCRVQLQEAAAPAQEKMTEHAHHHAGPLTQFAVAMYGQLGDQMGELRSKAEGGCQDSKSTLRADAMHSVESMLKALKDPEMRKMIEMGMMLRTVAEKDAAHNDHHSHEGAEHAHDASDKAAADDLLTSLESQLSKELEAFASAQ
jgi:hypothetical protein